MKNSIFKTIALTLLFLTTSGSLRAQSGNYVASAHLQISITHQLWPDVFLNGHKIVDSAAHLFDPKSFISVELPNDQLCYLLADNALGVEVDQTLGTSSGTNAAIGVAYNLKITLSDGSVVWVTSDDGQARKYKIEPHGNEPPGWASVSFDDSTWAAADIFTPTSMGTTLINPQTGLMAKYFETYQDGTNDQMRLSLGEKIYFRRKFSMDVITRPGCVAPRDNKPKPTATPKPLPPTATPMPPTDTFTPVPPRPTHTPRPRPTATFTHTPVPPRPTATPRPVVSRPKAKPTATATDVWTDTPVPEAPTATPRPKRRKPTATPTDVPEIPTATPRPIVKKRRPVIVVPTDTFTPVPVRRKRPTATPTTEVVLVPTDTPMPPPQDMGMAATIVFVNPPVNIDASFADGPGQYKLEIVAESGAHVNTLYDHHVGFEKETWLSWDGTNDQGRLMHYGQYYALFSKDGKIIQKIALTWIPPGKNEGNP